MLLKDMKVGDLYVGDIEGKNEFSNNIEEIEQTFLNLDHIEKNFIEGKQYFIYGHKGTGKTSLLKYIEFKVKEKNEKALSILFKDIKQEPLTYISFKKLLNETENKDIASITFWQWFILSFTVQETIHDYDKNDLIFHSKNSIFKQLANFLITLINSTKFQNSNDYIDTEINLENKLNLNETNEIFIAGQKIAKLERILKNNLNEKVYILIDELETSTLSNSFKEDIILIKNLILSVNKINNISENLNLIIAVRTEILNNVFISGEEINKLLESKGEEIKWTYDNYGLEHPLMKMMIKKLKYSMLKYSSSEKDFVEKMTDEEIFHRWFPDKLIDENGNNAKFLLHNTWSKPRDLVRFLQIMKKHAKSSLYFERVHYDNTVKEYSNKAWIEIKEELISIVTEEEILDIEQVFSNYAIRFYYNDLVKRFKEKTEMQDKIISKVINNLYNLGILGNAYSNGTRQIYRYVYRGDIGLDTNEKMEIHRGLWRKFSLKHELKYKNSINKQNKLEKDTNLYLSLGDIMRESLKK